MNADPTVAASDPGDWCGADPFQPDYRDDPYPALNHLRETDPVNRTPVGPWRICRYDDLVQLHKEAKTSQTLSDGSSPTFAPLDERGSFLEFMLNKDGEHHKRLRKLALLSLNFRTARRMEDFARRAVDEALDKALRQGGMELISDFAQYVPSRMTCDIVGIPEADRSRFAEWTAARTNAFFAKFLPPDVQKRTRDAGEAMADYFEAMVRERRKNPGHDLVSQMIMAEDDGDRLDDKELAVQAIGITIAGYETTIGLIGNGIRQLLNHPDQLARLRDDPEIVKNAVEECLRFDTPIHFHWRILTEPYQIGGKTLPADSVLWLMVACGNRDPRRFPDPDVFDVCRKDVSHLSFGGGVHFCLGNAFGRMEARHAFGEFARRTAGLRIEQGALEWSHSFFRVIARLPLTFH
ncbi:MAG: cytochrome P450 [Salinisphaera sp.]|nr:cytochrome P450 [Salinisphaera sp.]